MVLGRNFKKGSFFNLKSFIDKKGGVDEADLGGNPDFEQYLLVFVMANVSFQGCSLGGSDSDKQQAFAS